MNEEAQTGDYETDNVQWLQHSTNFSCIILKYALVTS
jgi:hypothetical protein